MRPGSVVEAAKTRGARKDKRCTQEGAKTRGARKDKRCTQEGAKTRGARKDKRCTQGSITRPSVIGNLAHMTKTLQ